MVTVNQYISIIKNFFGKHNLINSVLIGNDFDFNAKDNILYPVVNIEYVTERITSTNTATQFEITIADLFDPNIPFSEYNIYSDANQIADDFITYFGNLDDIDYEINEDVSIQKFSNGNVDRTAGCVFVITFNQFRTANDCIIPYDIEDHSPEPSNGFPFQFPFILSGEGSIYRFPFTLPLELN